MKGYRLYDPTQAKVIFSRDVVFKENCDTKPEATESEGEQYVELDLSSDEASLEPESVSPEPLPEPESTPPEPEPAESTSPESATVQPLQIARRSTREKRFPDYFGRSANLIAKSEPNTVDEMMSTPERITGSMP